MRPLKDGTLHLDGPPHLIDAPTSEEIHQRIASTPWRLGRHAAEEHHRLGLIESRIQLDYLCSEAGINDNFISFARTAGVKVEVHVRPRGRSARRR